MGYVGIAQCSVKLIPIMLGMIVFYTQVSCSLLAMVDKILGGGVHWIWYTYMI
jgi:hypothetical protein